MPRCIDLRQSIECIREPVCVRDKRVGNQRLCENIRGPLCLWVSRDLNPWLRGSGDEPPMIPKTGLGEPKNPPKDITKRSLLQWKNYSQRFRENVVFQIEQQIL